MQEHVYMCVLQCGMLFETAWYNIICTVQGQVCILQLLHSYLTKCVKSLVALANGAYIELVI